jgi:hypothetical protein
LGEGSYPRHPQTPIPEGVRMPILNDPNARGKSFHNVLLARLRQRTRRIASFAFFCLVILVLALAALLFW